MKRLMCLLFLSSVLVVMNMHADILPRPVDTKVCVQITNLSDFPDMAIVGMDACNTYGKNLILVNKELPLSTTAKFHDCPKIFYVVNRTYLKKVGMEKIDWATDKHVQQLNVIADWNYLQTEFYSTLEVDFKLAKKEGTYYVYKTRLLLKNRNRGNQATPSTGEFVRTFTDDVVNVHEPITIRGIDVPYTKDLLRGNAI